MQVCSRCCPQQAISDKVIQAATVVTAFLLLLSIFHCSGKVSNELFGHAFNAIWVFTVDAFLLVGTFFLQVCHPCRRGCAWLTAFKLLQRKEAHHLGLICTGHGCIVGWFHHFLLSSLPHCSEIIQICLFITTCFEVMLPLFLNHFSSPCRSSHASIQLCDPAEGILGKKPHKFGGASTVTPLTLTQSLSCPFAVEIAPGSGHLGP